MRRFFAGTGVIVAKELRIELRTVEILVTAGLFGLLVTVLTSLAFFLDDVTARKIAPGVLWVSASFAAVLAMGRAWAREREADAIRGLLLSPIPRAAIYAGKTLGTLALVLAIDAVLLPVVAIFFRLDVVATITGAGPILALGTIGYVAMGTLFASMSVRTRARELMLSVVLFPLAAPGLLAGVVATRELFGGAPLGEVLDWLQVLLAFDLIAIVCGLVLFRAAHERLIEVKPRRGSAPRGEKPGYSRRAAPGTTEPLSRGGSMRNAVRSLIRRPRAALGLHNGRPADPPGLQRTAEPLCARRRRRRRAGRG
ncbi:MAG: heme exporter protein CcmB [Sandaracinaceae bacterium]|nr:heme exporter protein CcmB [Sandaracinaceae bacterium]